MAQRFESIFEMIESALVPELGISSPNKFAVQPDDSIGEVAARNNIFGRPNSVSLLANKLTPEFPNVYSGGTEAFGQGLADAVLQAACAA